MKIIVLTLSLILSFSAMAKDNQSKKCTFSYTLSSFSKVYETDSGEGIYKRYTAGDLNLGNLIVQDPSTNWIAQGKSQEVECGTSKYFFLNISTQADKLRFSAYVNGEEQLELDLYKNEDYSKDGSGKYFIIHF